MPFIRVSDRSLQDSWTNDPPQPPSARVSAFDVSFPGTLPVRALDAFSIYPSLKFRLAEAEPNLCCPRSKGCTGLELKCSTSVDFRQEALFLPRFTRGIPNHPTLWYSLGQRSVPPPPLTDRQIVFPLVVTQCPGMVHAESRSNRFN